MININLFLSALGQRMYDDDDDEDTDRLGVSHHLSPTQTDKT